MATALTADQLLFLRQYFAGTILGCTLGTAVLYGLGSFLVAKRRRKADRPLFKIIAAILWILTLMQILSMLADAGRSYTIEFNDYEGALQPTIAYSVMEALNSVIATVVLGFYTWRCWTLYNRSWWIVALFAPFVTAVFATGIYDAVRLYVIDDDTVRGRLISSLSYILPPVTDLLIVILMMNSFRKAWGLPTRTGRLLLRLATLTITTNCFTTLVNSIAMLSYFLQNDGDIVLDPLVAHCYSLTFLVWLHARNTSPETNNGHLTATTEHTSRCIYLQQTHHRHVEVGDVCPLGHRIAVASLSSSAKRPQSESIPFDNMVPLDDEKSHTSETSAEDVSEK